MRLTPANSRHHRYAAALRDVVEPPLPADLRLDELYAEPPPQDVLSGVCL